MRRVHTHTFSVTHPPGRSLILLRIFGWIEAKGRNDSSFFFLSSLAHPIWVTFLFTNKAFATFLLVFLYKTISANEDTGISVSFLSPRLLRAIRNDRNIVSPFLCAMASPVPLSIALWDTVARATGTRARFLFRRSRFEFQWRLYRDG